MTIETKLDFKMYLNLMYTLTYRKPTIIILSIIGLTMVFSSALYFLGFKIPFDEPPYSHLLFGFFFIAYMPFSIYRTGKKNFSSYSRLQEKIIYEFTDEKIKLIGETFNSEMDWTKIHKILELKDWVLIYQNSQFFNLIPKESFSDKLDEFKDLVKMKGVKAKLKK